VKCVAHALEIDIGNPAYYRNISISVYNLLGRRVIKKDLMTNPSKNRYAVPISINNNKNNCLSAGKYIVSVQLFNSYNVITKSLLTSEVVF
jgi:hypothetical protein